MKRKVVKGFAIVTNCGNELCQWTTDLNGDPQRFNCYDSPKTARKYLKPYAHMKAYKIVPCAISYELPRKARRVK